MEVLLVTKIVFDFLLLLLAAKTGSSPFGREVYFCATKIYQSGLCEDLYVSGMFRSRFPGSHK